MAPLALAPRAHAQRLAQRGMVLAVISMVLALTSSLMLLASCGGNQRARTVRVTLVSLDAARDGFVAWDAQRQADIVRLSESREDGEVALAHYRASRDPVVYAFGAAYRALAVAASQSDGPSLQAAVAQAALLLNEITALRKAY